MNMKTCESCGMPTDENTTSKLDARYCNLCQDQSSGELASNEQTKQGMIQGYFIPLQKMAPEEAEKAAEAMMAQLPRWAGGKRDRHTRVNHMTAAPAYNRTTPI